jgi:uncharacterized protein (UPF0335 family)
MNKDKEKEKEKEKYNYISLKDVLIFVDMLNNKYIGIKEHIYYISLEKQDSEIYTNYVNKLERQKTKNTGTWSGFKQLYENIKNNGFDFKNNDSIIIKKINNNYFCLHGRHRICMMRHLYGDNVKITLKGNKICNIEVKK